MTIKSKTLLPFDIKGNSEVTGGYTDQLHNEFYPETEVTNHHEDDVVHDENSSLAATIQSPFTERWVGGRSYRHVSLNTGSDSSETRPEGYHVDLQSQEIRLYSHAFRGSPPAYWTREGRTKRPINIKNIGNEELYAGNYNKNYDFLQTSGRRITNNLLVDDYIANGVLTTQYITGANEYTLPELDSAGGSKSVIVERFNAPGSKQESSRGALDREGEEMSPNIPVPFRNHYVRRDFYNQLSQSTPQGGGTIHQVNRNRLVRGNREYFDNGYVTHAIPRTDIQYSWITASSNTLASELGGYQSFRRSNSTEIAYNKSEAFTDIDFISGSLVINDSSEYFVDNAYLKSLVKDKKSINLDTNTFSVSNPGTSASFSEITNTNHTYTTWTSLRTGDNLLSRQMRKNNIISILDKARTIQTATGPVIPPRGDSSTNYTDPVVTFKYKPLRHIVSLGTDDSSEITIKHDYANQMSTFANKNLLVKLNKEDDTVQYYDLLREQIRVPEESSIFYKSHHYNEIVWPKEENTGLDETRKRKAYYLDQPGFTRDGYDIQLGTQRAFWRDNQTDRKRSNLSDGGYYSSFNQLSTEETGSDFQQNEDGALSNNVIFNYNLSFTQNSLIDKGLFNSISLLENLNNERELYLYSGSVTSIDESYTEIEYYTYNSINKRGYLYNLSGEFNNIYNDFYEQSLLSGGSLKKSLGSLYRNTSYKSLLTSLPEDRTTYTDLATKTEDEQIFANNKVKYISFVGGAELNNGNYVQNALNFTNTTSSLEYKFNDDVHCFVVSGSDLYVGGEFTSIGDTAVNRVAKWDGSTWSALGSGITGVSAIVKDLFLSGSDIYAVGTFTSPGSNIAKWNGTTWSSVDATTFNGEINTGIVSGSDIYIGGDFTSPTGRVAKWDGASWSSVGATTFNNDVYDIILSGSDIYVGGSFTSPQSRIAKWDGASWSQPASFNNPSSFVTKITLSGSNIYVSMPFSATAFTQVLIEGDNSWRNVSNTYGLENKFMILSGSDFYFIGESDEQTIYKAEVVSPTNFTVTAIDNNKFSNNINSLVLFSGDIYAGGDFETDYNRIAKWDGARWSGVYINDTNHEVFSLDYFSQSFNQSDFMFSTMDNGLIRTSEQDSGKKPFFDSYTDYAEDIRGKAKDYSVIPEFNISENMSFYDSVGYNFRHMNSAYLTLDGISGSYRSANSEVIGKYKKEFMSGYVESDILKKKDKIEEENRDISKIDSISVRLKGIKKLLPYNGFYPQDRTAQLANLYSDYVEQNLHGGTFNLSYRNDYFNQEITEESNTGGLRRISSISVVQHNDKYVMATGNNIGSGSVSIFTSSIGDPTDWQDSPSTIIQNSSWWYGNYGQKVHLISASNGVNLISYTATTSSAATPLNGYLTIATSSNYVDWTTPEVLEIYGSSPSTYISGSDASDFALYYDLIFDTSSGQEKVHIAIGSPSEDDPGTNNGSLYYVTGTLVENQWQWSDKDKLHTGASDDFAGTGVSIISCSSGLQIIFGAEEGDNPSTDLGNILVLTSSSGIEWSSAVIIASGNTQNSNLGRNDIKAIDFDNKTHVFFAEPRDDIGGLANVGAVYTITSSINNEWPETTSYLDKKLIYYKEIENDNALSKDLSYSISVFSGSDERLYYAFANSSDDNSSETTAEYIIGYKYGESYLDHTDSSYFKYFLKEQDAFRASAVAKYTVGDIELPIFFTTKYTLETFNHINNVIAIRNNIFTEFKISTEGKEKYFKQAAIEPVLGPGILYNTIKSGIAVDWPCVTGSNTAIQPYGDNTIVNAYYPKSIKMAEYDGDVVYESTYGLLRDRIDYRAPFESLIFPEQVFVEKEDIQDITTRTVLSTIEEDDPVTLAIKDTYVYGGYEPYISPIDFSDIDNLGPKKFSIPFVYRKKNASPNTLYSLAMSNFLAESVKFFLKGEQNEGKMVSFVSKEDDQWGVFESGKTYYMDVILEKSKELVMMEAWHSDKHPIGSNGEKMNGRYFGYPVNKTDKDIWGSEDFTLEEGRLIHNDPAYAPYTPPYYEGKAIARISFTPPNGTRSYTFDEVIAGSSVENIFNGVSLGASTGSNAYLNAMPVGSSVNLFGSKRGTILDSDGLETQNLNVKQWVISPKMETPVLDFSSSQELVSYQNEYSKTSGFGRGMWSGYGQVPENGKQINLKIDFPFPSADTATTGSLVEKVFQVRRPSEKVKTIGRVADQKVISEAVVVIPYLERRPNDIPTTTINKIYGDKFYNFIRISDNVFREAKNQVDNDLIEEETTITKMISSMKKYVIPPNMNFLQYDDIKPFVMYIFEVEHTLDQEDLVDIWQGLMPKISYTAEEIFDENDNEGITIEHQMGEKEFFHGRNIPEDIKWMVFKVKRKAEYDYANVTEDSSDDERFLKRLAIGRQEGEYSYNWPYDYFSLVELAKVEIDLEYKKKE